MNERDELIKIVLDHPELAEKITAVLLRLKQQTIPAA